jgi:hypothetical protein
MAIHKFSEQSHITDKGTPKYMASEVIDSKKYNTKTDIIVWVSFSKPFSTLILMSKIECFKFFRRQT